MPIKGTGSDGDKVKTRHKLKTRHNAALKKALLELGAFDISFHKLSHEKLL